MKRITMLLSVLSLSAIASTVSAATFELQPGDHVCIVGNTLAERMQHFGWLETMIHARFPRHELVFRNLGYSGDEVNGFRDPNKRMRSMDFGSHDQWLSGSAPVPQPTKLNATAMVLANRFERANTRADVVFACYGYGESFAGEAGLAAFRQDLDAFIKHTLSQKYNGKSPPRLVLFSPIAHENLKNIDLPDGVDNNKRLELYSRAMAETAQANGVFFVDLFARTQQLFAGKDGRRCTTDGVHLNAYGDSVVAGIAAAQLFAEPREFDRGALEKLRAAVNEKNEYWFRRYRATDGYSSYGDRAFLRFVDGQTNYEVVQRELEAIDILTANRDKVVWAVAQGKAAAADDSNLPAFVPVVTNKPGPLAGGKHQFLSGRDSIAKMTVHKGMKVELVASEEEFPELVNPVQMAFDTRGRLWVAAWRTYPHWKPTEAMDDKLLILEDADGDGRTDKCITFAGDLHNPTGFEFWGGGVIVAQGPDILFLKDVDGDDRYDVKERILHGLDTADTHHTANSFTLDAGGALYFQEGTFHHTQVETPWGPTRRVANGAVFRYEPRTHKFDVYVSFGFANPHGHVFDGWGQDIVVDGTGAVPYHGPLFSSHLDYPHKHGRPPQVYQQRTRPCPAIEVLSSSHFPEEFRGNLLVGNVIGFQGILQYKMLDKDSSLGATELEPILSSSDPNFRPADVEIGADGAIYFTDWQNPIIGHMQHNLRDPSRDREHGRVYRVTFEGRKLLQPPRIAGERIEKLLDLLKSKDDRVRYRVRIELSGRETRDVIDAASRWIASLDAGEPGYVHHMLEALWLHQSHNVVQPDLLERLLTSPDGRARAAAVRVCAAWQDRLPHVLDLLRRAATDDFPRVRLMAIWAATFVPRAEAAEAVFLAQDRPGDPYIDFLAKEALRTLGPLLDDARAAKRPIAFTTEAGARHFLKRLSNDDLLREKRERLVFLEILNRPGLSDDLRREAVQELARMEHQPELRVIMDAISRADADPVRADVGLVFDLIRQLNGRRADELASVRAELEKLALSAKQRVLRQIGFASLINVDGKTDRAWALGSADSAAILDLVEAVPLISDASVRAGLYSKIEPLLYGLPPSLGGARANQSTKASEPAFQIRRAAMQALVQVRGEEAKTFRTLAGFLRDDVDRTAAVRALQSIPRSAWPKDEAPPLLAVLIGDIRKTPTKERTSPATLDVFELCDALANLLPADQAKATRAQLRALGVRVIKIGTVFERMSYDKDVVAVQAGKPVEFVLENSDLMPHNFVITRPGALETIGLLAEAAAQQPAFAARHFVPQSPQILLSSVLLQPRDSQKLSFNAPAAPGVYPFVCTYPGHWRRMYGALYVVADLDAYLADPEAYLARAKLVPQDPLLKDRRPRTEWTFGDLAGAVEETSLQGGRNFGSGKQIFTVANCVACHKLDGAGNAFGPDLAKLDAKWKPADILNELLTPSARLNEKFQTNIFELGSGKQITGLVLEETPDVIKVIENPLAKSEPIVLKRGDIVDRQRSKTSLMPKGLLDKLTRDEILDLVAFVAAGANRQHSLFQKTGHDHHHTGGR